MRTIAVLLVVIAVSAPMAAAASGGLYGVNGSEPSFLRDIGPQDERADNPLAAAIVAAGVALVILRGLHRYTDEE